jgi:hypothetical protein
MLMNPDKYKNGIIAPHLLEGFYNKCLSQLSYENKDSAERVPNSTPAPGVEEKKEEKEELVVS